jgi:hypothetical protein
MKTLKSSFFITLFSVMLFAVSCKKNTNNATTTEDAVETKIQSNDAAYVDGETESVDDDVNNVAALSSKFCGVDNVFPSGTTLGHLPPDADTANPLGNTASRIILTYNGHGSVGCRKRTGTITIDLLNATRWVEPGAVLRYTFTNFKIEDTCKQKSIMFNGERFVTNVSGGNLFKLRRGDKDKLVHKIRTGANGMQVTFVDSGVSKTANWNVAKLDSIRFTADVFYFWVNGDTTINNIANTSSWGTTRNGKAYQTWISNTIKANTHCLFWRPTAGLVNHNVGNVSSNVLYGLDAFGNAVASGNCATHFKLSWQIGSASGNSLIAYR